MLSDIVYRTCKFPISPKHIIHIEFDAMNNNTKTTRLNLDLYTD